MNFHRVIIVVGIAIGTVVGGLEACRRVVGATRHRREREGRRHLLRWLHLLR